MPRPDIVVKCLLPRRSRRWNFRAAMLNPPLRAAILQRRAETPSIQASNASGWHSDREIATLGR